MSSCSNFIRPLRLSSILDIHLLCIRIMYAQFFWICVLTSRGNLEYVSLFSLLIDSINIWFAYAQVGDAIFEGLFLMFFTWSDNVRLCAWLFSAFTVLISSFTCWCWEPDKLSLTLHREWIAHIHWQRIGWLLITTYILRCNTGIHYKTHKCHEVVACHIVRFDEKSAWMHYLENAIVLLNEALRQK